MSFVDTRFHINTSPLAEHKIASIGCVIRHVLFEDDSKDRAVNALKQLTALRSAPSSNVEALFWHESGELDRECAHVCTNMNDHLKELSRRWVAHLHDVHSEVRALTKRTQMRLEQARMVHTKYRSQNPHVVDKELREELYMLNQGLVEEISVLRARPLPSNERSDELNTACRDVKRKFAESHGRISTPDIIRCKETFDNAIRAIESNVCSEFVESVMELLE